MQTTPILSIVMPCKNEGKHLHKTLSALISEQQYGHIKDITFVDNGSTDDSLEIARQYPITVLSTNGTISKVRNTGVLHATGSFLCFLDADIEISDGWTKAVIDFIEKNRSNVENIVFGDAYGLPDDAGWIEKIWFKSLQKVSSHINSGNMVVSRSLFERLGGFDETLVTAEDYDICQRAESLGGEIIIAPGLKTIHYGYPGSLKDFYRRERWHGLGMSKHLFSPHKSKPLLVAYITMLAPLILAIIYLVFSLQAVVIAIVIPIMTGLVYCMLRLRKFASFEPIQLFVLITVYIMARTHSLLIIQIGRAHV